MFVGMGTVFVFLGVLVIGMMTMSTIAMRFTSAEPPLGAIAGPDEQEVAAMTAAIAQHRKTTAK
jgi:sodium pump decarboxylase gamma subunit